MRALKPATTTGRPAPAAAASPARAAASDRSSLRSAWWPWPRSPAFVGWPAAAGPRKKPAG
jgi:hypothetical protein